MRISVSATVRPVCVVETHKHSVKNFQESYHAPEFVAKEKNLDDKHLEVGLSKSRPACDVHALTDTSWLQKGFFKIKKK